MSTAHMSDLGYALGELKTHVEESAVAGRLVSPAGDLADAGFRWHHRCGPATTAYDLAAQAVARLAAGGLRDGVDAIVYATCLPCNANTGDPAAFARTRDVRHLMAFPASRLQADFGLDRAVVVGLTQQACTGMLGALRVAGALLHAEPDWQRVLCVTADRFPGDARYEQAYNLISDAAAACLVARNGPGPRLVTVHQITNGGLHDAGDDATIGSYFSYLNLLVGQTLQRAGLTAADLGWVIPQNTNARAGQILARLLGVDHSRVWMPSLADVGHAISADTIINLAALLDSGRLRPGQFVLLVVAGHGLNWQAAVLQAPETSP